LSEVSMLHFLETFSEACYASTHLLIKHDSHNYDISLAPL